MTDLIPVVIETCKQAITSPECNAGDSLRIFHGRGKTYPGLSWCSIDFFSPVVVITLFQDTPGEWLSRLCKSLVELFNSEHIEHATKVECIVVQRRYLEKSPFEVLYGNLPDKLYAVRNGLKFQLSFSQQNLGFFLDIEPARCWLEKSCNGANVLNLFSYTCAFSVVAKAAGADSVVNIDMSRKSLNTGRENHIVNDLETSHVRFLPHDIFKSWGKLKKMGPYDIVIIDPPSFQKGSFIADKDYKKVLARMASLVKPGGWVLACLNSPEVTRSAFRDACDDSLGEQFVWEQNLAPNAFFPDLEPENALKMIVYQRAH